MTDTKRIPLDQADAKTLAHFAMMIGLETKSGMNAGQLRGLIQKAMPDVKDVPPIPAPPEPVVQPAQAQAIAAAQVAAPHDPDATPANHPALQERAASRDLMHYTSDPKVGVVVMKTDDKRRAKDVQLSVNGDVIIIKRGERVEIPYRFYEALLNAREDAAVETDEINPFTGNPVMDWQEVQSYPFQVFSMPSEAEVAAWRERTQDGFKRTS